MKKFLTLFLAAAAVFTLVGAIIKRRKKNKTVIVENESEE